MRSNTDTILKPEWIILGDASQKEKIVSVVSENNDIKVQRENKEQPKRIRREATRMTFRNHERDTHEPIDVNTQQREKEGL